MTSTDLWSTTVPLERGLCRGAAVALVATEVRALKAAVDDTDERALLRAAWDLAHAELPRVTAARRIDWTAFVLTTAAPLAEADAAAERLLAALDRCTPPAVPWFVVMAAATGSLPDDLATLERGRRECRATGLLRVVAVLDG